MRKAIERRGERMRSISWDYAHEIGNSIAELALRHRSLIILEDLEKLRENGKRGRRFNKRPGLWFYRRVQFCTEYEAMERNLEVVKVDPRGTSSRCPRCGGGLVENGYRVLRRRRCGFVGDRDVIATVNLYMKYVSKYSRCGGLGVPPNAPEPDEAPSGVRGNRYGAMTASTYMNLYGS
jgi:putative transposase